ncbi:MAG: MFS transporter [Clostridia bacterium]|nr:MFS transporter [Clostridia bacterium]
MSQDTEVKTVQTGSEDLPAASGGSVFGKRYVGAKELVTLFVTGEVNKFNLEGYLSYFMLNVFGLDSRVIAAFAVATLAWDLINDSIFAYIVDRTRTRFGKFKPWAFATIGPYAVACIALWVTPLFIGDQNWGPLSWQKIVIYCVISVLKETIGTLYSCAINGLNATYTPSIDDKAALIALDNIGDFEKVPSYAMVLLLDLAAVGAIGISVENVYIFMGAGTVLVSMIGMFVRICVIKERIVQVEEKPKLIDGLRNFFGNKLQVLLTLSDILSAFGNVGGPFSNMFWLDVMGSASLQVICGVPASPLTYVSYMYLPKLRKKFSTKTLWIMSRLVPEIGWIVAFVIGFNNLDNLWIMIPALMFREMCISAVYSIGKVIPQLMQQEIIDYGEWKTGKRTEAMTSFISGLATKIVNQVQNAISTAVVSFIGYEAGVGTVQTMKTKQAIFAMYSVIPIILGIFAYIPMFMYKLDDKTKTIMYHELTERRANIIKKSQENALNVSAEEATEA